MIILDGKKIADEFALKLQDRAKKLELRGIMPKLAIISIDPTERSLIYIRAKQRRATEIGIAIERIDLPLDNLVSLKSSIQEIAARTDLHGIILQLPIPAELDAQALIDCIPAHKDVDGLTRTNQALFTKGKPHFWPATARGVFKLMRAYHITPTDKTIAVIGQSRLVGQPIALLLKRKGAHVLTADSKTSDIASVTIDSDIVITCAGSPGLLTADMIKKGAAVIDVGITQTSDGIRGDTDFDGIKSKVSYITPVPGGVGPMTVVMLMSNVLRAARRSLTD